jgi:hypothetical protein
LVESGVVGRFGLGRQNVADRLKQSTVVEPVDPFKGGVFDVPFGPECSAIRKLSQGGSWTKYAL